MSSTTQATDLSRSVDGRPVPGPGTWRIDPSHSSVGFTVRHLMVGKTRGRFTSFSGAVEVAERPEDSSVEVSIDAASIDTSDARRDDHLRSGDFLEAASYPALTFRSTGVAPSGDGWRVSGDLTIRDVTRSVVLDVEFGGAARTPWDTVAASFSATTEIDREDWGLTYNQALEAGGVLIGKKVKIEIEVEAVGEKISS